MFPSYARDFPDFNAAVEVYDNPPGTAGTVTEPVLLGTVTIILMPAARVMWLQGSYTPPPEYISGAREMWLGVLDLGSPVTIDRGMLLRHGNHEYHVKGIAEWGELGITLSLDRV
jgi:hypothetical protein